LSVQNHACHFSSERLCVWAFLRFDEANHELVEIVAQELLLVGVSLALCEFLSWNLDEWSHGWRWNCCSLNWLWLWRQCRNWKRLRSGSVILLRNALPFGWFCGMGLSIRTLTASASTSSGVCSLGSGGLLVWLCILLQKIRWGCGTTIFLLVACGWLLLSVLLLPGSLVPTCNSCGSWLVRLLVMFLRRIRFHLVIRSWSILRWGFIVIVRKIIPLLFPTSGSTLMWGSWPVSAQGSECTHDRWVQHLLNWVSLFF